jgi:hypothetical protein
MIQEARMAVPPEKGAQVNADETLLPGAIEDAASTESFSGTYFGSRDQGPVHNTTTTSRTRNGSQARKISRGISRSLATPNWLRSAFGTGTPP